MCVCVWWRCGWVWTVSLLINSLVPDVDMTMLPGFTGSVITSSRLQVLVMHWMSGKWPMGRHLGGGGCFCVVLEQISGYAMQVLSPTHLGLDVQWTRDTNSSFSMESSKPPLTVLCTCCRSPSRPCVTWLTTWVHPSLLSIFLLLCS